MGREPVSWTTKDKAGIFGWSILIYDSPRSMILRGWRVIFLAKDKGKNLISPSLSMTQCDRRSWGDGRVIFLAIKQSERPIGGILSMTQCDRRSLTKDASSERDKDSFTPPDWLTLIYDSFHSLGNVVDFRKWLLPSLDNTVACLAILLPSRYGC